MSTEELLWVILQDRRREAAQAARERLARSSRREVTERTRPVQAPQPVPADGRTFGPVERAPGR